jgi:hypothetical protein
MYVYIYIYLYYTLASDGVLLVIFIYLLLLLLLLLLCDTCIPGEIVRLDWGLRTRICKTSDEEKYELIECNIKHT